MAWRAGHKRGERIMNPDCEKSDPVAKLPGVKAGDYSICSFASRASLEKALLAPRQERWKTSVVYSLRIAAAYWLAQMIRCTNAISLSAKWRSSKAGIEAFELDALGGHAGELLGHHFAGHGS